jgi:CRISPR system Cascade subunit CasA
MTNYSLVDDKLLTFRRKNGGLEHASLPEVLSALWRDDVVSFEALQTHQEQAWHSFLVQLAAMAVARECDEDMPSSSEGWRNALVALAGGREEAWHLVVDDLSKPAFMQSPVPEGSLEDAKYKADVPTPDQLDMLITSKNHDVKQQRITNPRPEHWVYALVTLQTMEGFLGRGNYGIVRMNGGFGNRPMVGLATDLSWGRRFARDLNVLRDERDNFVDRYKPRGHALLWIEDWDGAKSSAVPLEECDPYFIEICRRIRFTLEDGDIACWRANTSGQRVDAPDSLNGATGDPWTPVEKDGMKALTLGEAGFTYDRLYQIFLSGEYTKPPALEFQEGETGAMYLVARTLVRGQGKTDGLHYRIIPVPASVPVLFQDQDERRKIAVRAQQRVDKAAQVQTRVLRPAVAALVSGRRDNQVDWEQVQPWIEAFDEAVDDSFFPALWESVEQRMNEEEAARQWAKILQEEAKRQFDEAQKSAPHSDIRRWRAISTARSIFQRRIRDVLPAAFQERGAESADHSEAVS